MNWIEPLLWILPAYFSNASATLSKYLPKRHPIDGGRTFLGGRILGDGKTWEGFFIGIGVGSLVGALLGVPTTGFLLSLGSMLGDLFGSFIKRRIGLERGEEAPLLDQVDFLIGAFFLVPPPPDWAVFLTFVTPLIHKGANVVGHLWGVKREPW